MGYSHFFRSTYWWHFVVFGQLYISYNWIPSDRARQVLLSKFVKIYLLWAELEAGARGVRREI